MAILCTNIITKVLQNAVMGSSRKNLAQVTPHLVVTTIKGELPNVFPVNSKAPALVTHLI